MYVYMDGVGWVRWVVLKRYEWIRRRRRGTTPFMYDISYIKEKNILLVHETILSINLIKLTKNK